MVLKCRYAARLTILARTPSDPHLRAMPDPAHPLTSALANRYQIERELGQGGMATVYLAHDVRHDRKVALKVLRAELAAIVGIERFLHEIKTTANLQHPHILPLHDSGQANGLVYYVMPYVEGESLRDRLTREKQLPVEEAVRIAREVADALDYAHRHGVVHRDIKPENILQHDGHVVVADFGIALAVSSAGGATRLTESGMSLGTPHYMSPEQAMGEREITAKSDVYALGCVLYEMLVGEPPFTGPTAQAIVARVMTEEPRSLTLQRRSVPPHLEAAVNKALEKVPADRFATAKEFAEALVNEGFRHGKREGRKTRIGATWAAALLVLGALLGGAVISVFPRGTARTPLVFLEAPPKGTRFVEAPVPSPDGRKLAMLVTDPAVGTRIWLRFLGAEEARPVLGTEGASLVMWSPDSEELIFNSPDGLRRTRLDGSGGQLVSSLSIAEAVWTPDDQLIVASGGILAMPARGGAVRTILEGDQYGGLDLVPTGPHLLFRQVGAETGIHTLDLSTGDRRLLVPGAASRARYVAPDMFLYVEHRVLLAQRFDPRDMRLVGDPFPVAQDVGSASFSGSSAGALSFIRGASNMGRQVWLDRRGQVAGEAAPAGQYSEVDLSPDGKWMMFVRSDPRAGNLDLWVQDVEGNSPPNRFTTNPDIDHLATFSPDGKEIAWEAHGGVALNLMRRPTDGSAPATLVRTWDRAGGPLDWSRDGRFILYGSRDAATGANLWAVPIQADAAPFPLIESAFEDVSGRFSPDGRWLAYASDASGQSEIYVQRLDDMRPVGGPQRISDGGGRQPQWRRDGTELFFLANGKMMAVDTRLDRDLPAGKPRELFDLEGSMYAVTPDGQRFLVVLPEPTSTAEAAVVILDWAAGLNRR